MQNKILEIYKQLYKKRGHPKNQWVLWCKNPKTIKEREEVIIGSILTQQTNWKNVEKAIKNLKFANCVRLERIYNLGKKKPEKLKNLIRPSGFYNIKTKYLINIARFFVQNGGVAKFLKSKQMVHDLRSMIHNVHGVGQETADSILLYALDKPVFVIDEYTKRFARKEGISKTLSYSHLQRLFEKSLTKDFKLYQIFHALIVINGQKKQ
ncbi:MAG: endonuclease [Parcubacteria group bacterium]|nr:endonuclease [Parcubacteria group bacterium]